MGTKGEARLSQFPLRAQMWGAQFCAPLAEAWSKTHQSNFQVGSSFLSQSALSRDETPAGNATRRDQPEHYLLKSLVGT